MYRPFRGLFINNFLASSSTGSVSLLCFLLKSDSLLLLSSKYIVTGEFCALSAFPEQFGSVCQTAKLLPYSPSQNDWIYTELSILELQNPLTHRGIVILMLFFPHWKRQMIPHVEIYITPFQIQQLCPHMQTPPWSRFVGYLQSLHKSSDHSAVLSLLARSSLL